MEWINLKDVQILSWRGLPTGAIWSYYSQDLVYLIGRMLDPDPQKRPSAAEILEKCTYEKQEGGYRGSSYSIAGETSSYYSTNKTKVSSQLVYFGDNKHQDLRKTKSI